MLWPSGLSFKEKQEGQQNRRIDRCKRALHMVPKYEVVIKKPEFVEGDSTMNIEAQFNLIAEEYDCNRRKFIPCFDDYYENSTKFIISSIKKPKKVLDLGAGTGLLSYYWYVQCSSAEYVLVDIADEMLDVSRKRFSGLNNVQHRIMDYTKALPRRDLSRCLSAKITNCSTKFA